MRIVIAAVLLLPLTGCMGEAQPPVTAPAPAPAAAASRSSVQAVADPAAFDALVAASAGRTVVVDFHAEWCGPCKTMSPRFAAAAAALTQVVAVSVDVDAAPALAQRFAVEGIPLFVRLRDGREIDRRVGAMDQSELQAWMAAP